MAVAVELEIDAAVDDAFAIETLRDSRLAEQVRGRLLEHTSADALLAVLAASLLEDDGLDSGDLEQTSERESGWAGTDDADLRSHASRLSRTRRNTRNALFAAGTPQ